MCVWWLPWVNRCNYRCAPNDWMKIFHTGWRKCLFYLFIFFYFMSLPTDSWWALAYEIYSKREAKKCPSWIYRYDHWNFHKSKSNSEVIEKKSASNHAHVTKKKKGGGYLNHTFCGIRMCVCSLKRGMSRERENEAPYKRSVDKRGLLSLLRSCELSNFFFFFN